MEEQINLELSNLQEELILLDAAVKQIEKAGAISNSVIEAIQGVQESYGKHLQKITNKYEEYLDKSLQNTDSRISALNENYKANISETQKLMNSYLELAEATARLPEEINKVDFPVRLDMIDTTTSNIYEGILNTQKLIDSLEKRLKNDYIKVNSLEKQVTSQGKKISTMYLLVIISTLATLSLLVLQFFPNLIN